MSGFTSGMRSSLSNEWSTPPELFAELDSEFCFDLDAASTHENALCEQHFTKAEDGLAQPWEDAHVWLNPPYGREIGKWMRKAAETRGGGLSCASCPPARTRPGGTIMWPATRRRCASCAEDSSSADLRAGRRSRPRSWCTTSARAVFGQSRREVVDA